MRVRLALGVIAAIGLAIGIQSIPRHSATKAPGTLDMSRYFSTEPSREWFEDRAFPNTTIPTAAYEAGLRQAVADHDQARLSTSAASWQFMGPDNIGGRISAMAVAPGGLTIYIASANGGVFKSTDGGVSWTPIFDQFSYYSIGALALDPTNPDILYVGTGEAVPAIDTYDGNGVYRTNDGGATWQYLGLGQVKRIAKIAIDPLNNQRIMVAGSGSIFTANTDHGIYKSEDGGASWTRTLYVDSQTWGSDVVFNPVHPDTLYAGTWGFLHGVQTAVYRSTDSGSNWTRLGLADGLPASTDSLDHVTFAFAPSKPTTIYAMFLGGQSVGFQGRGVWRSTNGGATWVKRDATAAFSGSFGGFAWYFQAITVDPTNPDRVYAGGVNFLRSIDGGTNWGNLSNGLHADVHSIWVNPSNTTRLLVGCDGGFYRTTNSATSWTKGVGLPISQFYAISVDPQDVNRPLGGTQDNNTIMGTGGPSTWSPIFGGDGFYCLVDPIDANIVFAESQNMSGHTGPWRSTNGGLSFPGAPSGFVSTDRYAWNAPFVMDPIDDNVMLAGSHRVYKSVDNGQTYSIVSGDLAFNSVTSSFSSISTLAISPVNDQVYYSGSRNGKVYCSTDAGATWLDRTAGLPTRTVTRVTADPFDANIVYCSLSGFNGSMESPVHLYRSTNQGSTWTNISGNLPNMPVNDILVDDLSPSRLYAGTDLGVYTTLNGGVNWYPMGLGLPYQAVHDLYLHSATRTLFAGTHGRSMWKIDLSQLPTAVEPRTRTGAVALSAPSPNPSHGDVSFTLTMPGEGRARVSVFDAQGRLVRAIHSGPLAAGRRAFVWDGRDAAGRAARPGVYLLRADTPSGATTQRVIRAQ